jgi:hypothetical protein
VVESWNSANRFIFYGRAGELSSNRRDDQELAMLALHLLQISLFYLNTRMIQDVLRDAEWRARLTAEDYRGLTPLIYGHVNPTAHSTSTCPHACPSWRQRLCEDDARTYLIAFSALQGTNVGTPPICGDHHKPGARLPSQAGHLFWPSPDTSVRTSDRGRHLAPASALGATDGRLSSSSASAVSSPSAC